MNNDCRTLQNGSTTGAGIIAPIHAPLRIEKNT